jgi:hypothetical protein
MPDSQVPPLWGPAYDERDLDALLSGQTGSTPAALQPVESTLAALRAAATRRELSDESAARAAFRALAPAPTSASLPWTAADEHPGVTAHTLVLPPAGRQPRATRHRHRRPAAKGPRKPRIALAGVAAAALIAVAAVVTGALTGSIGNLTSFGRQPASASASARATGQSPASQGLLATGAARESPQRPKPSVSATPATPRPTSGPGSLCREYFEYVVHPAPGDGTAWMALYGELSKLAGGPSPAKIYGYCLPYLDYPFDGRGAWPPAGAPASGEGPAGRADTGSASLGAGSQGDQPNATVDRGQSAGPGAGVNRP